jgi:uncharacterized membrane protein YwaF
MPLLFAIDADILFRFRYCRQTLAISLPATGCRHYADAEYFAICPRSSPLFSLFYFTPLTFSLFAIATIAIIFPISRCFCPAFAFIAARVTHAPFTLADYFRA